MSNDVYTLEGVLNQAWRLVDEGSLALTDAAKMVERFLKPTTSLNKWRRIKQVGKELQDNQNIDMYIRRIETIMRVRTTQDLVIGILGRDYDTDKTPDIAQYMLAANVLVSRVVALAAKQNYFLSDDGIDSEAEVIERWLSAHFYQASDKGLMSSSNIAGGGTHEGRLDMGLNLTRYGQNAMILDTSGVLKAISQREIVSGGLTPPGAVAHGFYAGRKCPSKESVRVTALGDDDGVTILAPD